MATIGSRMVCLWLPTSISAIALLHPGTLHGDGLSPLGSQPDWARLQDYQNLITRDTFLKELTNVYALDDAHRLTLRLKKDHVRIKTGKDTWRTLHFRQPNAAPPPVKRFWRPRSVIRRARKCGQPLAGLRVALDPGHLGGRWAQMEERWYRKEAGGKPVAEGDMTLLVATLLQPRLEALGAQVLPLRTSTNPATPKRPKHFASLARADLAAMAVAHPAPAYTPETPPVERRKTLQWHSERYFYRRSEIRARAALVNNQLKPDLVLCLHFNAAGWGQPSKPQFVPDNHLHLLINGAYSLSELGHHDERFEMLMRIVQGMHAEERALAEIMAQHMARQTQLPAYQYVTNNVKRPSANPYLYARNLLANRLYQCPVIYLEPYVMNSNDVYARVQAGLYPGKRLVNGQRRVSIYDEYSQGIIEGLLAYYGPQLPHQNTRQPVRR